MAKSKLFIFKTNSLSNDKYLLKLNRLILVWKYILKYRILN